jgi:type III pantothenate kinase
MRDSIKKTAVLVVDVGNSHTVIGVFKQGKIREYWRLTTRHNTTSDEVFIRISGLMNSRSAVMPEQITHVGLSSVVPILERTWVKALQYFFNKPVHVVSHTNCLQLPIGYANPAQLGADRICNVVAALERGYKNAIIVDLGTATSFEVLYEGVFKGGVILPGISTGLETLTSKAARLMPVSLEWTNVITSNNTDDAVRSGLLYGFLGQLEYLILRIKEEWGFDKVPVIATGGWSGMLQEKQTQITDFEPYLTLEGIRLIALKGEKPIQVIE